jgi:DEAD/DEAH box helicase domain-containing protein
MPDGDVIVYDIETKETFQEVGSRDPRKLHISMIGAYSYNDRQLYSFTEDELGKFWRMLENCSLLIGFNNKGFDDQVVSAYFAEIDKVPKFDILEEVYKNLGFRVKLDNIAHATLGVGKSGDGLKAIQLYREGKIEELRAYCLDDVKITQQIYDYGRQTGELKYSDMQGVRSVQVDFRQVVELPSDEPMNLSLF